MKRKDTPRFMAWRKPTISGLEHRIALNPCEALPLDQRPRFRRLSWLFYISTPLVVLGVMAVEGHRWHRHISGVEAGGWLILVLLPYLPICASYLSMRRHACACARQINERESRQAPISRIKAVMISLSDLPAWRLICGVIIFAVLGFINWDHLVKVVRDIDIPQNAGRYRAFGAFIDWLFAPGPLFYVVLALLWTALALLLLTALWRKRARRMTG
jgi:hypothetical protein